MISHAIRWAVGGLLYGGLELAYRGRTHWTMLLLAALLFIIISHKREEKLRRQRAAKRRAEREKAMKQQDV